MRALLLLILSSGCTLQASATCRPDNVVVADVEVTVSNVSSVRVANPYGEYTLPLAIESDGTYRIPVLGLIPGATNHLTVEVTSPDGTVAPGEDLMVDCNPLPSELPSLGAVTGLAPEGGYLMVSAAKPGMSGAMAAVIDYTGRLYWYRRLSTLGELKRLPNGNFVYYDNASYVEESLDGAKLRSFTDPLASRGADNHDILPLDDGHALLFGLNQRDVGGTLVTENTVAESDGNGGLSFHWSGADHVGLDETTPDIDFTKPPVDIEHANSMDLLSDGNLLISFRHTDTLYKLDRKSGDILWRLGGGKSNFTFVDDSLHGFSHQHYARQLGNGDLLLLDNGNLHTPPGSRVVQYQLDETTHTAKLVWEHRHRPSLYSSCCGSAVRLSSGNTLTAWGTTGIIEEVDADSNLLWEMTVPGAIVYRAQPIDRLYPNW